MHATIEIDCVDCHGGDGTQESKERAHVQPRNKQIWKTSANPPNSYAWLNEESPEFVRFMNPSDLRIAHLSCGPCHGEQVRSVRKSIMGHNAMVHNAVFYNNGSIDTKIPQYGEAFDVEGRASMLVANPPPSREAVERGALARLAPHPQFQITRIQDPLRVAEVNNPALGTRGPGTDGRIAGVFLNALKTRLNDPTLWMMGPNKIAGDYRTTGCASCHVPYANARDETSAQYAEFGNRGFSFSGDKAIPKNESGHPIRHQFTRSVPASQCMVCHYHQGDGAIGTYFGLIWWDRETEAEKIKALDAEPEYGAGQAELWDHNSEFNLVQFGDHHAHGWNFMKVYKRDFKGNLLDAEGNLIAESDRDKWKKAVHLKDIHFEKGLHCIDCHTKQDMHGDGNIYSQMRDAIEIRCTDCHGTVAQRATLKTSGPAGSNDLSEVLTPFGMPQFEWQGDKLIQRSKMDPDRQWEVKQLADVVNPESPLYNERAAYAKLLRPDGSFGPPAPQKQLAHGNDRVECFTCHSSWTTTCSGCHLPLDLNVKSPELHFEPTYSRGYAPYYRQVIRTDTFFLGIGSTYQGNKVTPFRPASAAIVSAYDRNRNNVIHQQPLISAPGFANEAMTPHPPHTVRTKETKQCTDCHLSQANDNNARIATLLGFGVNAFTFFGQYSFIADRGHGVTGIQVTEGREPQPVIGSNFHRVLHPQSYDKFEKDGRRLRTAYSRRAPGVLAVTYRGEYLLSAEGADGFKLYDIANINNKAVAQRIVQAVNSPLGERTEVASPDAAFIYFPSSLPVHYGRKMPKENREQELHAIFRFAFGADRRDGLILIDVNTLTDNDPENNRLQRDVVFNPGNKLRGAVMVKTYGRYAYVVSEETGLSVVDINTPFTPRLLWQSAPGELDAPNAVEVQLRYAFVLDRAGMKVFDITNPEKPALVPVATVPVADARGFSLFRTYAVIAAGAQGMAIVDITNPEKPGAPAFYNAEGALNDANDVAVGATNVSFFAYVADGKNGLRIVRLAEPPETPGHMGYSPPLVPKLIATYRGRGEAVMVARGHIRDRYVDESGNQVAVSNRIGSRPFNAAEIRRFLYYPDGRPLRVTNEVPPQLRRSASARLR